MQKSHPLFRNIRFYVLVLSFVVSLGILFGCLILFPSGSVLISKLTEAYALTAVFYLYATLLVGPLIRVFPKFPFHTQYFVARRALGVSSWYFALIHACFAFFGELGGFQGLFYLDVKYLTAISLSFLALLILSALAATSFEKMIRLMTYRWWKFLHRFVYLAGILILIHAVLLGSHFVDLFSLIPQILFFAVAILLMLHGLAFDKYMTTRKPTWPRFGISFGIVTGIIIGIVVWFFFPTSSSSGTISFGVHAAHVQIAKDAQQQSPLPANVQKIPGLNGDRTRRYTVSFLHDQSIEPNADTTLHFQVFDANSGAQISLFNILYTKPVHMIIVDSSLAYFSHIHPTQQGSEFVITTQFPKADVYHIYLDFQPLGGIEQQFGFSLPVGDNPQQTSASTSVDVASTQTVDGYEVILQTPGDLQAQALSIGEQLLTFHVVNATTKQPVKTIHTYLGAFGHLVMVNTKTYDYLHVHPNVIAPSVDSVSGPDVTFLPLGLYGPIKPGVYRIFVQLNPDNHLIVVPFTVTVH